MSLLEDIFLQDETNEAQQLERVIEGNEFDERLRSDSDDNSEKEDEAEEDKKRVDPTATKTKRVVRNPRFILNPARLSGPRGIQVIPDHFKDFKFKGRGHEKDDLDLVLKKLEHWAYRLYPKFQFGDCLKKIEMLGKKRPVMVHLHKIRSDQYVSEETVVQRDSSDDDDTPAVPQEEDEFDRLLQQQIELARSTPAPNSLRKLDKNVENGIFNNPKATSSPSISEDQRERMLRSRRLAEEKRLARLKNTSTDNTTSFIEPDANEGNDISNIVQEVGDGGRNKKNRSNIIDSSDEEDITIVETVTIDIHDSLHTTNNRSAETIEHVKKYENKDADAHDNISPVSVVLSNSNNDTDNATNSYMKHNKFSENSNDKVNHNIIATDKSNKDNSESDEEISVGNIFVKNNPMSCKNTEINNGNINNDDISCDLNVKYSVHENVSIYDKKHNKDTHNNENTDSSFADPNTIISNIDADNIALNSVSVVDSISNNKDENNISDNEIVHYDKSKNGPSPINSIIIETGNKDKTNEENVSIEDELMDVDFSDDF